ncbi:MAG: aminopeptidase N, partial [Granulosicoccaceae bacterium]
MSQHSSAETIYLKDYAPSNYLIDRVELRFELGEEKSFCHSLLALRKNPAAGGSTLRLDGHSFKLLSIALDGVAMSESAYRRDDASLEIDVLPEACVLEISTELEPQSNTALEGLYKSSGNFCTQCEAEGFRRITYFLDRPDVLSRYRVEITADKTRYPVLLSNGNPAGMRDLADGKHTAVWEDPHPKPSYLFALVAGDLACVSDRFKTREGRDVALNIYTEAHNAHRCDHAMASLKHSMTWDEKVYGLCYDLDVFNIVAVDDFNMGAMENKGLNIFNSKYVLADQQTATDADFQNIESVIAHEYFHNWSGNRVTCRDWFQLSLKEGLTVFRDQEFSADRNSRAVKRIEDVRLLRARQFPEDAGPMAHPVRPESYIEINNFYTVTIYEKGAELIRMMHTLLGADKYRAGLDLYFERHDGQAVTCEDFVKALEDASGVDLEQFRLWYSQLGTPSLFVSSHYDQAAQQLRLNFEQKLSSTSEQTNPQAMHIPVKLGLLRHDGSVQRMTIADQSLVEAEEAVLDVKQSQQSFVFEGVDQPAMPSLLRGFSAPVRLSYDYSDSDLGFLISHDS